MKKILPTKIMSMQKLFAKKIGIKTVRQYQELYNISDALLLADVLANFRDVCIKNYNLDPAWFYTAPGLAWEAMLKITKVELELLGDVNMMLMLRQGIRGGVAMVSNRFSQLIINIWVMLMIVVNH